MQRPTARNTGLGIELTDGYADIDLVNGEGAIVVLGPGILVRGDAKALSAVSHAFAAASAAVTWQQSEQASRYAAMAVSS